MYVRQLTQNEIKQKRLWLKEMASGCKSGSSREKAPQSVKRSFDFSSPVGAQIYASFSDQELLDILHRCGKRLGYSPSQKEVFWIYRAYIRQRFGNWPKALRQAGLCVSTGRGDLTDERLRQKKRERERLLQSVRTRAKEFGRVPHPRDAPELVSEGVKYFYTWFGLLYAANVVPSQIVYIIDDLEPEYVQMLAEVQELHEKLGHPPLRTEMPGELRISLIKRCGSWRNVLFQTGVEPAPLPDHYFVPLKDLIEENVENTAVS